MLTYIKWLMEKGFNLPVLECMHACKSLDTFNHANPRDDDFPLEVGHSLSLEQCEGLIPSGPGGWRKVCLIKNFSLSHLSSPPDKCCAPVPPEGGEGLKERGGYSQVP